MRFFILHPLTMTLLGVILLVGLMFVIESFVFSWVGFSLNKIDWCDYKSVSVKTYNGQPLQLSFEIDTHFIESEMRKNNNYEVKRLSEDFIVVSRKFDEVYYEFKFNIAVNFNPGMKIKTMVDSNILPKQLGGEKCTTPNYILKRNAFLIINDLPFNEIQKDEIKQGIKIACISQGTLW